MITKAGGEHLWRFYHATGVDDMITQLAHDSHLIGREQLEELVIIPITHWPRDPARFDLDSYFDRSPSHHDMQVALRRLVARYPGLATELVAAQRRGEQDRQRIAERDELTTLAAKYPDLIAAVVAGLASQAAPRGIKYE
ncbi:hypothetical protein [Blastopirellula marina]|uniref:hypothetical protein n=1 Tax=Blastopirellula marina TaxID=124 RepID=UPI0011B0943C|nr:hypothetical protein [Blastopirellula marina]